VTIKQGPHPRFHKSRKPSCRQDRVGSSTDLHRLLAAPASHKDAQNKIVQRLRSLQQRRKLVIHIFFLLVDHTSVRCDKLNFLLVVVSSTIQMVGPLDCIPNKRRGNLPDVLLAMCRRRGR